MIALDIKATPAQKLDFILNFLYNQVDANTGKKRNTPGKPIDVGPSFMHCSPTFFGMDSPREMVFYLETLHKQGLIELIWHSNGTIEYYQQKIDYPDSALFTFKGLNHLSEIENNGILSNRCFVAMAFDEKKEKRLSAIKEACQAYNFEASIVEEYRTTDNQTIDSRIIGAIKSSRFCIADFTGLNQGAYMEAGFAMGRDMKVIFICESEDFNINKKHFDVNHYPFIFYNGYKDLTNKLKTEIAAYI